ncbi:hypothetical protein ACQKNB_07130 [Lysinibacillus xylanilyticus]|uniref:hypothetical protein n=1 Tax=Lysinibacillus xylanilyticus TaxID=582475 RepID=UPI003D073A31
MEVQGDTLKIKFEEANPSDDVAEQYVYKITKDPKQEIIEVYINTHFDHVITGKGRINLTKKPKPLKGDFGFFAKD